MGYKLSNNFWVEVDKQVLNNKAFQQQARELVENEVEASKEKLINDFTSHPVSQEIAAGPAGSKSKYLVGPSDGNLFSFIGFDKGDNPIRKVVDYLKTIITVQKKPIVDTINKRYRFIVNTPSIDDPSLSNAAPMPRGTSTNWLYAIEKGISGIHNFIYRRGKNYPSSDSGPGVQVKNVVRRKGYHKTTKYLSGLIDDFIRRLGGQGQ